MILTLTDTTRVQAQPAQIRRWLSDVENWPKINPKIKSIAAQGDKCIGMLEFKGREIEFAGIIENRGGAGPILGHILFRKKSGRESRLNVAYSVTETPRGAIVTESVTFLDPIPLWAGVLIKLIYQFGRSKGPTNLENIARHLTKPA